jgi:phenylacetate-CoA ligase
MKIPFPNLINKNTLTTSTPVSRGEKMALDLFHSSARNVPAYRHFLEKEKVKHEKVRTYDDFKRYVPVIDKKNYLSQYPLSELCLEGDMFKNRIISVSSGSSGTPFYWPRGLQQDLEGADMFGNIYDGVFQMDKKSTLLVICFSMGTWIAGSFTTTSSFGYADKGRPVNIVTPGLEKGEAINAIKNLSSYYDQVVIVGYPPFVKDIVEEGKRSGIKWSLLRTRLLMAGEAFSEEWRDYVLKLIHSKDPYYDSVNIYGSADAGILGNETPLSVLVRRIYNQRPKVRRDVFGVDTLPSIVQYDPQRRHFEEVDGDLIFTSVSGIPLVRYNIKDTGGVLSYMEAITPIEDRLVSSAAQHNIDLKQWQQPFVYLNGRKDFSVTIYAVNIYPENIKAALIDRQIQRWVTGRFTMATANYSDMDQYFEVNVELAKDFVVKAQHQALVEKIILDKLLKLNTEFHKLHTAIGVKALPRVHLVEFDDPRYFSRGIKHKWVKKEA